MSVRVLETQVLHAGDVVYWLHGGTGGGDTTRMQRLRTTLQVALEDVPRDAVVVHGRGRMAVSRRRDAQIVAGRASEAQRARGTLDSFTVSGVVSDPDGRFNPRAFSLPLGGHGDGHGLAVYPSPHGSRLTATGGLLGMTRWDDGTPAPWALLSLVVTTAPSTTLRFHAQSDAAGSFVLALDRLPPLPESVTEYSASLTAGAEGAASAQAAVDPDTLSAVDISAPDDPGGFQSPLALTVRPGEVRNLRSFGRDHLALRPQ